jgi:hypothetical protein
VDMLTMRDWLGGVNFAGDPQRSPPGMDRFLTVRAAGAFFVPPVGFPGLPEFTG